MSALGAMLFTRAWPRREVAAHFDEWQHERHFPELTAVPGVERADYYRVFDVGVPQVLRGSGNRIAVYWSSDLERLLTFLSHPALAAAVADGSRFFPDFNELDGDTYTGNIYTLDPPVAASLPAEPSLLVERYEVPDGAADDFDRWVRHEHVPRLAAAGALTTVILGSGVREDLAIPYYNSPGNRMVLAAIGGRAQDVANDLHVLDAMADAQRWDRRLDYVRRELAELAFTQRAAHDRG